MEAMTGMLRRVISDVLERMFFVFPEEAGGDLPDRHPWRLCRVPMSGERSLSLRLYGSDGLGVLLGANFLGLKTAEVSREMAEEAVKEGGNVIAGSLLNELGGDLQLGLPELLPAESSEWLAERVRAGDLLALKVESYPLLAGVFPEETA